MKKVAVLTACICFLLCSYRIDVSAMDKSEFILRSSETIDNPFEGDFYTYLQTCVYPETDHAYINEMLDSLSSGFDFSVLNNYDYYYVMAERGSESNGVTTWWLDIYMFNSTKDPYIVYTNPSLSPKFSVYGSYVYNNITVARCKYVGVTPSSSTNWYDDSFTINEQYFYPSDSGNGYSYQNYSYNFYLMDTNLPVYILPEITSLSGYENDQRYSWTTDPSNRSQLTNLFPSSLEGYNASGSIVSGDSSGSSGVESNSNHMYFKNCELGFCVPQGTVNSSNYGGAYAYIKYTVDDWVVNHISDYEIVLNASSVVGSGNTLEGSYHLPLDRDGCVEIPFSDLGELRSLTSYGFISSTTNNVVEQNYYKTYLYSVPYNALSNFIAKNNAAANTDNISTLWSMLSSGSIYTLLLYNGEVTQGLNYLSAVSQSLIKNYSPYSITLRAVLRTTDRELHSGPVETTFNLVTGNQNTTNTGGLVNDNPFDPQPDPENPDVPSVPQGNSTDPTVVINTGGIFTGQISAGFDPGYDELKQDVNLDPQGNFSQYLDPMHNTEVGSWFMSFVNEMPTQMKLILISGCGVGVLFGLYRFIRRG